MLEMQLLKTKDHLFDAIENFHSTKYRWLRYHNFTSITMLKEK